MTAGLAGCEQAPSKAGDEIPSLKNAYDGAFMIGAAVNVLQTTGDDRRGSDLVRKHFNSITPENVMKWALIHPEPGVYDFEAADRFVEFGETNDMHMVGHTLVWHSQIPGWVFEDEQGNLLSREALLERMRDHIFTVVGRYKGRVHAWDVVNEALNEDGTLRESLWYKITGKDYLVEAFRYAREADPDAALYYNDYSLENADKREGAVELIRYLKEQGAPVTGIGTQGHFSLDWPDLHQVEQTIVDFAALDIEVMVTELDIDVLPSAMDDQGADVSRRADMNERLNPYTEGLPDSVQDQLTRRYSDVFNIYLDHRDVISRVTFWGVTDGDSWKNNWPVQGRTNYPLIFDRDWQPKPAFHALIDRAREHGL